MTVYIFQNIFVKESREMDFKSLGRSRFFKLLSVTATAILCLAAMLVATSPRNLFPDNYATVLTSADGELLGARLSPDEQWRFPPIDTVPDIIRECIVQYEDKRFYRHFGIDVLALARATKQNLTRHKVVSGGSTITMQVSRLSYGTTKRTLTQKIKEAWRSLYIELAFSKDEILAMYVSHAPFGGNTIGIAASSWRYFGRDASRLSWAESATLAVLPNSPALVHPGKNRDLLLQKRNFLLGKLLSADIIDNDTYELSVKEDLVLAPKPLPNLAPHLLDKANAKSPGKQVRSTLDAGLQQNTQSTLNYYVDKYKANHIHNAAVIVCEVKTGNVVAYCGNTTLQADDKFGNQVDIISAPRSSGSILKPFLYSAMLQDGTLLPSMLVPDIPTNISGFTPQNYKKTFSGAVPASNALTQSLNVPMVRLLQKYSAGRFLSFLRKIGLTTLPYNSDHYGASLILGGAEVCLWDLCGTYSSMARILETFNTNNSQYNLNDLHPLTYEPVQKQEPSWSETGIFSAGAIYLTFDAMSELNRPEEEADWHNFNSMKKIAWKTGTSFGSRDAWAIGVTPNYVVGVWVGNASGEGRAGMTGVGFAAPIMFSVFSKLPQTEWFEMPYSEMEIIPICRKSGFIASELCEEIDSLTFMEVGKISGICPYHHLVHLTPDGKYRVNNSCMPVSEIRNVSWFTLPPTMAHYYSLCHLDYKTLPPYHPDCIADIQPTMQVIYPENYATLVRTKGISGEKGKFVFRAAHSDIDETIYWYIDDCYIGTTESFHEISVNVETGRHVLTITDAIGNQVQRVFYIQ